MARWDTEINEGPQKRKRKFVRFEKQIIFEDERVVVVDKPGGIASLTDREDGVETPLNMLRLARNYNPELMLCHRLDKATTGVLLFAKGRDVYRHIAGAFAKRDVLKHYLALVHGAHKFEEEILEAPIDLSGRGKARINFDDGKEAATVFSTAERFRDYTVLDCHPLTGRMHQIRVHAAAAGCPLVGDTIYGGKDIYLSDFKRNFKPNRKMQEPPINDGFLLHARGLRLLLPGDEEESTFIAPLPKKFEVALKILRKYNQED